VPEVRTGAPHHDATAGVAWEAGGRERAPSASGRDDEVSALIAGHLPLVRHVVFQVAAHFPRHVDREELSRAGALGLVEAAHRYVEARGVPFNHFASQRIRGAILDAVRAADWAPRSVRNVARAIEHAAGRLTTEHGRTPTHGELAEAVGVPGEELTRLQARVERATLLALDHPVAEVDDEVVTLGETVEHESPDAADVLERRELHAYLRSAIRHLTERQRIVVVGYFLEGRSSADLAALLGVTESRISQIRSEALHLLRDVLDAQYRMGAPAPGREGRGAGQRFALSSAIAAATTWRERLDPTGAH
jgi:RNA polymerase sigma factor for flagellar operon FliA